MNDINDIRWRLIYFWILIFINNLIGRDLFYVFLLTFVFYFTFYFEIHTV